MVKNIKPEVEAFARIRVIGIGGSGSNAIGHMIRSKVQGVDFIAINTDAQDLHHSKAKKKIHIGKNVTRGLGTGMNPELGRRAAEETKDEIHEAVKGSDMIFITGGLGGGTGTGAAPIVAKIARESGALTIGIVTKPFSFEGLVRSRIATEGAENLKKEVDALITIPNDRLLETVSKDTSIRDAFAMCDDILKQAVEGISDLITTPGLINVDFADIRAVMEQAGSALMGVGIATGEGRAVEAALAAVHSPLLDVSINGATGVLFAIAGGEDLGMLEVQEAATIITQSVDPEAKIIFGAISDDSLKKNQVKITVIATGFPEGNKSTTPRKAGSFFGGRADEDDAGATDDEGQPFQSARPLPEEEEEKPKKRVATRKSEKKTPKKEASEDDPDDSDDSDWGTIPSFLKRSKLK